MLFNKPTTTHTHSIKHYVNLQVDFKYGELVGCFKIECELPDYKELSFYIMAANYGSPEGSSIAVFKDTTSILFFHSTPTSTQIRSTAA